MLQRGMMLDQTKDEKGKKTRKEAVAQSPAHAQ